MLSRCIKLLFYYIIKINPFCTAIAFELICSLLSSHWAMLQNSPGAVSTFCLQISFLWLLYLILYHLWLPFNCFYMRYMYQGHNLFTWRRSSPVMCLIWWRITCQSIKTALGSKFCFCLKTLKRKYTQQNIWHDQHSSTHHTHIKWGGNKNCPILMVFKFQCASVFF